MAKKVSITIECKACHASGLYEGLAERDNSAVVCRKCNGTGATTIEGTEFEQKQLRDDIVKVFHASGFCISRFSRGGVSYDEWVQNPEAPKELGNELRDYQCPRWHYQSIVYKVKTPLWDKCTPTAGMPFTDCEHFDNKHQCWEQLDKSCADHSYDKNLWNVDDQDKNEE
jgi:hypothetical protein